MTSLSQRTPDRVESFIASIDIYQSRLPPERHDLFRLFARFVSRSLDGRYLDRHPPNELLPEIEDMLEGAYHRPSNEIVVEVTTRKSGQRDQGVLRVCLEDQQFLYSTVQLALEHLEVRRYRSINTAVPVSRDAKGCITGIGAMEATRESYIWIEIEAGGIETRLKEIEYTIRKRIEAVRAAVNDWRAMHELVEQCATRFDSLARTRPDYRNAYGDNARLLRWMLNEHFVLLGTRLVSSEQTNNGHPGNLDLGVGRFDDEREIQIESAEETLTEMSEVPPFLWIRKSRTESWTYRSGKTDHVVLQFYDEDLKPAGILMLEGLFSFHALAEPRTDIPVLDRVIDHLYAQLRALKGSHRYRTIRNAFNSLPLEYLFTLQPADIRSLVEQVLDVDTERRLQVHITADETQSSAFIFVALPRSHYNDELRSDIRQRLKSRLGASSVDDGVYAGNVETVTFHFYLTGIETLTEIQRSEIRDIIDQLASPWAERLLDELQNRHGEADARRLHSLYSGAFPNRYHESTSIRRAAGDIEILDAVGTDHRFECDVYREDIDKALGITRIRIFESEEILLSSILPMLDNLGLVVIDQFPTTVHVPGRSAKNIATFRIGNVRDIDIDLLTRRNRLRDTIKAWVAGAIADDPLNRLLLRADIPWTYVVAIRAYEIYARQIGSPYGSAAVRDVLLEHADIVRALTEYFRAKFDPNIKGLSTRLDSAREAFVDRARTAVMNQLETVADLTSDQVLRMFVNLVDATVRTNFFTRNPITNPTLALKFDPALIARMPDPRPFREAFVYHPKVMGLHLRGGPVARGGIRWSDRRLDFRTEVLGLMATQNLKNALIVPRGAKGSFVLLDPPPDPAERRREADRLYRVFIGGLLDVVDNLRDGVVHSPEGMLRYEEDDHYLVVAADKGTAHLSDTANGVADERSFWLSDAFASGGSAGYDHKKEGITARGAWECVKRHFREVDQDPERDPTTVVGIGDMSGDVFGNGLLRSKTLKLLAAFDHRNIFLDPDPDPETSYACRLKLFETPGSSWEDYPKASMSAGAGVFPRRSKSIVLTPEVREMLGVEETALSGQDLIRAILRMDVDLWWNGGIGTYVRSTRETDIDVGDPTNDPVRIDASEFRARVVGEGGNLGITAEGRIELAERGVRLNTDAIDNSAGVDLSDHEVNLKILFDGALRSKEITRQRRDEVLEEIRTEINTKVLRNNWNQSRMISLDAIRSVRDMGRFKRAIVFLSERVPFDRRQLRLPGERLLTQRVQANRGLYRPELSIIAANAKLFLREELVSSSHFNKDRVHQQLFRYFPPSVCERYADLVTGHPLAINIARTLLTNRIIEDAGASWSSELAIRTGRSVTSTLEAYQAASELLGAEELKEKVNGLEGQLTSDAEYQARILIEDALESLTEWLLRRVELPDGFEKRFAQTTRDALVCFGGDRNARIQTLIGQLEGSGLSEAIASEVANMSELPHLIDIAWLSSLTGRDAPVAARTLDAIEERSGLGPLLRQNAGEQNLDDAPARLALRDRLRSLLIQFTVKLVTSERDDVSEQATTQLSRLRTELDSVVASNQGLSQLVLVVDRVDQRFGAVHG